MGFENNKKEAGQSPERKDRFSGDHWVLESGLLLGEEVADAVVERLIERGWSEDEIGNFFSVIKEATDNAVIHGNWNIQKKDYPNEDAYKDAIYEREKIRNNDEKKVTIDIHLSDDGEDLDVTIGDEGLGFSKDDIPDPTSGEGITKTSGRGWYMMNALADAELSVGEGKVILHWKKKRNGEGDTPSDRW